MMLSSVSGETSPEFWGGERHFVIRHLQCFPRREAETPWRAECKDIYRVSS